MSHSSSNWSGGGTGYPPNQYQNNQYQNQQQMNVPYGAQQPYWGQQQGSGQQPGVVVVEQRGGGSDGCMKGCREF